MRTVGELRATLTTGRGFPDDAGDSEAGPARELHRADPAGLSGLARLVRLVEEHRRRVIARQDPAFGSSVAAAVAAAVAELRTARRKGPVTDGRREGTAEKGAPPPCLHWATKQKHPYRCSLCTHRLNRFRF